MKYILLFSLALLLNCSNKTKTDEQVSIKEEKENLIALIDEIWQTEQEPIRRRDSLMAIYGVDSKLVKEQQVIIDRNHIINESRVKNILEKHGWPAKEMYFSPSVA